MAKRPAILLYTGDWLKDAALRSCSMESRGLWIDMVCYMHDCEPYGYLKVNLKVITPYNLAGMVGVDVKVVENLLNELLEAGVCEKMQDGTIYSKRMLRDEELRLKRAAGGKKGGNPNLKNTPKKPKNKGLPKGYPSLENEDVNENEGESVEEKVIVYPFESENFLSVWKSWKDYKGKTFSFHYKTLESEQAALKSLAGLADGSEQNAIAIIQHTIANQWKGFVKPRQENQNGQQQIFNGNNAGQQPVSNAGNISAVYNAIRNQNSGGGYGGNAGQ